MNETYSGALNPFPTPSFLGFGAIKTDAVVSVLFTLLFIFWVLYTLISAYHWFRYSHRSWIAVPALAVHILVSGFLLLFSVSGL
jgi:hypothetical protein